MTSSTDSHHEPKRNAFETPVDEDAEILESGRTAGNPREQTQLAEQLRVANAFDAVEQREPTPETLNAEPIRGSYWVQIDNGEAWLASNHVVKLGDAR